MGKFFKDAEMRAGFRLWGGFGVALALAGMVVTGFVVNAQADPVTQVTPEITHGTPKVPVVIDGVRYQPEQIHNFDGRALYLMVDVAKPDELVGFTKEADFKAAAEVKTNAYKQRNGVKSAGQYAVYYSEDELRGDWLHVDSGWGVNDLRAVRRGCGIFGCAGDWNDVISSFEIHGYQYLYGDPGYGGGYLWAIGDGWFNMSTYGFDNMGSSLNVWY
jgi:hypothetical protein